MTDFKKQIAYDQQVRRLCAPLRYYTVVDTLSGFDLPWYPLHNLLSLLENDIPFYLKNSIINRGPRAKELVLEFYKEAEQNSLLTPQDRSNIFASTNGKAIMYGIAWEVFRETHIGILMEKRVELESLLSQLSLGNSGFVDNEVVTDFRNSRKWPLMNNEIYWTLHQYCLTTPELEVTKYIVPLPGPADLQALIKYKLNYISGTMNIPVTSDFLLTQKRQLKTTS